MLNHSQHPSRQLDHTAHESEFGVTEIVLPKQPNALDIVMPMLAHRSQTASGWFTWINPKAVNKTLLEAYNFCLHTVRRVDVKERGECPNKLFHTVFEALVTGNSHTVVANFDYLSAAQLARLDNAAKLGGCTGVIIRFR